MLIGLIMGVVLTLNDNIYGDSLGESIDHWSKCVLQIYSSQSYFPFDRWPFLSNAPNIYLFLFFSLFGTSVSPEVILFTILPILLFESAFSSDVHIMRHEAPQVSLHPTINVENSNPNNPSNCLEDLRTGCSWSDLASGHHGGL
jgi:hypothetical protein